MSGPLPVPPGTPDPLAALRPYRLPDPVGWWPPAPGWWLLLSLLLVCAALLLFWLRRRRRCRAAARAALAELARLRAPAGSADGDALRALSRLLRRYALTVYPRQQVAGLSGEDWLCFLDAHGGDGRFVDGPGRVLAEGPYRPAAPVDLATLADLAGDWIRRNPGNCR